MPISLAIGIGSAIAEGVGAVGGAIATGLGALAPEAAAAGEIGAGVGAAEAGGAIALPEIAVTAAAPEVAAGAGTEAALGGGLIGGGLTGAEAAGAGLFTGAPLAGAAGAGALGATEALGGAAAPLTALSPADVVAGDFGALSQAGIGPSVDLSGVGTDLAPGADAALPFAPSTAPIDPFAGVGTSGSGGAFGNAPATSDIATALNTGQVSGTTAQTLTALNEGVDPTLTSAGLPEGSVGTPTAGAPTTIPGTIDSTPTLGPGSVPSAATAAAPLNIAPSPTIAGGGAGGAGGGLSGAASSLFSGSTLRTAAELAPLGLLGATLLRGPPSLPSFEQQAVAGVQPGTAVSNVAQANLNEAATGILQPGQQAQIDQYVTQAKNKLYQLYASGGQDPTGNSDYIQGLALIDQNAQAMSQNFITAAVTNGLAAQGVIDSTLQSAAQIQMANDAEFQQSVASATQAFGLVTALNVATLPKAA